MTEKKKVTKKPRRVNTNSPTTKPKPVASTKKSTPKIPSTLDGRLLHLSIDTDLDDQEEIDQLHEKIEERIEKKLKENGVENCIVFVSGPNIKLSLM